MSIRRLHGGSEHVGGGTWEIFIMEDPTEAERWRWNAAMDELWPPGVPEDSLKSTERNEQ